MPIKKSLLESKWYYRVGKTLLLLLPLFAVLYTYGQGFINFDWLWSKDVLNIIAANNIFVGQIVGSLVAYYIALSLIWKVVLYLVFGGIEDDMRPVSAPVVSAQTGGTTNQAEEAVAKYVGEQQKRSGEALLWIIFILCVIAVAFYGNTHSSFVPGAPNPSPKCVPTGCGSSWRCSGAYYDSNGTRRSINGCYGSNTQVTTLPSWSGTCRRCP